PAVVRLEVGVHEAGSSQLSAGDGGLSGQVELRGEVGLQHQGPVVRGPDPDPAAGQPGRPDLPRVRLGATEVDVALDGDALPHAVEAAVVARAGFGDPEVLLLTGWEPVVGVGAPTDERLVRERHEIGFGLALTGEDVADQPVVAALDD